MTIKIAIIQMDIAFGNPSLNRKRAVENIHKAALQKPDIIVLPEMWNTSFCFDNIEQISDFNGEPTISIFSDLARKYQVNIIAGSIADRQDGAIYNRTYIFDTKGEVQGHYDKSHLVRHANEQKYMRHGDKMPIFNIAGVSCGVILCYDLRFPEIARVMALQGAKILFVPAQWFQTRLHHWRTLLMARAIENQIYVVGVNRIGSEFKAIFPGHSIVVDPWGKILLDAGEEETILYAECDINLIKRIREKVTCFADRRIDLYK